MSDSRRNVRFLFALLMFESILIGGLIFAFSRKMIPMPAFLIAVPLVSLPTIIGILLFASRVRKQQRAELQAALGELGCQTVDTKTRDDKAAAFEPFSACKALRYGAKGVRTAAAGTVDGYEVRLLQHAYTVSTGQSSTTIVHTGVATPVPHGWPRVVLTGEHLGHKIAGLFGKGDKKLEDEAFNKAWHIEPEANASGAADEFTVLLLAPEVQAFLTPKPRGESWAIGRGWMICLRQGSTKPERLKELTRRVVELRRMLPPELDAFEG